MPSRADLVVFSHLPWNFVYQRPQHLLSRLADNYRIFFIQEPFFEAGAEPGWDISQPQANVIVARPRTSIQEHGFSDAQLAAIGPMMAQLKAQHHIGKHLAWFYTPMALPLLNELSPELVIFDSMDALDMFLFAPQQLKDREAELLKRADLVFTGGRSLFRRLQDRHANAYCFPSSVDAKHFGQAIAPGRIDPLDQEKIPGPRLGYFGVIDERIDLPLLDAVAQARPDWQIVMVGPVVKISPDSLPRRANIHYLGQKSYQELPGYLGGWDLCLLPFARNDSTRFISPTKTLEYMVAEKPIIGTPITDVAEPYGRIVYLADNADEFVAACDTALHEPAEEKKRRIGLMRQVLSTTSWDATVDQMQELIEEALDEKQAKAAIENEPAGSTPPVVIIGAGPTGLSAAYHLGDDALLLEQNERVGGWCRSIVKDGFTFDYAGHIMFSNDPYVHELYQLLLGDNVHWQNREAWIYSKNVFTRYPFQGALYGLPPDVIKECILGAIEARYGSLKGNVAANGVAHTHGNGHASGNGHANGNGHAKKCATGEGVEDCCGDGVMESTAPLVAANGAAANGTGAPRNFEEFIYKVWGAGIAKHFAIPYNKKLWAVPLTEMETSWLGGRVPMPDLEELIDGALKPVGKPMGPNARFGYPLKGGFQALMDGFIPHVQDRLELNVRVAAISPSKHTVTLSDGRTLPYAQLISTMPLPALVRAMGDEVPEEVLAAARGLRHVSVRCVHIGVGRANLTEKHWIYYPEQTVFHRIFVQGNASPHCNPVGGFGMTCEITYSPHKPLPCDGDALIQRCIDDCREVGIIRNDDPIWTTMQVDLPYAYVVYDHARPANVATIRKWMDAHDIVLAGRYSEWEYYNSDHAFIAGKKAAEAVQQRRTPGRLTGSLPAPSATIATS
jgi:UDP-galactopyranose mutase